MSALISELHSAQLTLNKDCISSKAHIEIINLLCRDVFLSPESPTCRNVTLIWISMWRSVFEKGSSAELLKIPTGFLVKVATYMEETDHFIVYEAQKALVEVMRKIKSKEGLALIHQTLKTRKDIKIVTHYMEVCRELLSKRNPHASSYLSNICCALKYVTNAISNNLYSNVTDHFLYEFVSVFYKVIKLVNISTNAESIRILHDTYFDDTDIICDILFETHVKQYVKRKLILALYCIVRPSSLLWRQIDTSSQTCVEKNFVDLLIKFAQLYCEKITESGYSVIKSKKGKVAGFVECCIDDKGGNPEVDLVLLREWCVLSLGFSTLLAKTDKESMAPGNQPVQQIDSCVKEELGLSDSALFPWLPTIFTDQDDMWIDALFLLLSFGKSVGDDGPVLQHHLYFLQFVSAVAYDHLVLIDLLTSPETCFLQYLTAYFKYCLNTWTELVETAEAFGQQQQQNKKTFTMHIIDMKDQCVDTSETKQKTKEQDLMSCLDTESGIVDTESTETNTATENDVNFEKESFVTNKDNRNNKALHHAMKNFDSIRRTDSDDEKDKNVKANVYNSHKSDVDLNCSVNTPDPLRNTAVPESIKSCVGTSTKACKNIDKTNERTSGLGLIISSYSDSESEDEMNSDECDSQYIDNTSRVECKEVLSAYEFHRHLEPSCTQPSKWDNNSRDMQAMTDGTCLHFASNSSNMLATNKQIHVVGQSCDKDKTVEMPVVYSDLTTCDTPGDVDGIAGPVMGAVTTPFTGLDMPSTNSVTPVVYSAITTSNTSDDMDVISGPLKEAVPVALAPFTGPDMSSTISVLNKSFGHSQSDDFEMKNGSEHSKAVTYTEYKPTNNCMINGSLDNSETGICEIGKKSEDSGVASLTNIDNSTVLDDNSSVLDDNATVLDDNSSVLDDNSSVLDDNSTVLDDNSTVFDESQECKKVLSTYEIHRHLEPSCTQPTKYSDSYKDESLNTSESDCCEMDEDSDNEIKCADEDVIDQVMGMLIRVSLKLQRMWTHQIIAYDPGALVRLLDDVEQLYSHTDKDNNT